MQRDVGCDEFGDLFSYTLNLGELQISEFYRLNNEQFKEIDKYPHFKSSYSFDDKLNL